MKTLCSLANLCSLNDDEIIACIVAAMIHDHCRTNNRNNDEKHGDLAVNKYFEKLRKIFSKEHYYLCIHAVKYHCMDDNKCPNKHHSIVWEILKDADALDRGRFDKPDKPKGCNTNIIRLKFLRDNPKFMEAIADLAYWIAQTTRHTNWTERPYRDLWNEIVISVFTYHKYSEQK